MPRYLVVTHQTSLSSELLEALRDKDREAGVTSFEVIVPATPVEHLLTWEEGETRAIASQRAQQTGAWLAANGLNVDGVHVGEANPVNAVAQLLRGHSGSFDGVIVATHPARVSRWLKLDAVHQIARVTGLPVTHVTSSPHPARIPAAARRT